MSPWTLGFTLGAVVVLVVAVLLISILVVARKIAGLASKALSVAGEIERATAPIWAIGTANSTVAETVRTVQSIEARAGAVADVLDRKGGRG